MIGDGRLSTREDEANEDTLAEVITKEWGCDCSRFSAFSAIDWYFTRNGRIVGLGELKCRKHDSTKYPTVFLNVRKWLALQIGAVGMGVPATFFVRFNDGIKWIDVNDVDARNVTIAGRMDRGLKSDVEPIIEVPIGCMHTLKES